MPRSQEADELLRECLAVRVRTLSRTLTRIYDAALRPHGITAAQLNLLVAIRTLGPAASGEVAASLSLDISTLSRNARLMERAGWITIDRAGRGNGRILALTRAGQRKISEATPAWRQAQKHARALLGDDGAGLVKELVDNLETHSATGE